MRAVFGDAKVAQHKARIMLTLSENVGHEMSTESSANGLEPVGLDNRVRGHHPRCSRVERWPERSDVPLQHFAGINGIAAIEVMTVPAVALCAITGKMLDDRGDAATGQAVALALNALHIGGGQFCDRREVFSKCARNARPTRVRGNICLRRERHGYADRAVFPAYSFCESTRNRRVSNCGKAWRIRPFGKTRGEYTDPFGSAHAVTRIRADCHWDTKLIGPHRVVRVIC